MLLAVIASEAKQSISPHKERMDCFVASLPCANASRLSQAMTEDILLHSRGAFRPSFAMLVPPSPNRGRRECRAPGAPAAARVVVVNTRVSHHGHTGNARHSPRDGFTAYFVLSPVIGLFCHRRLRIESANLTPASRRQDHTTSPSAFAPFVKGAFASTASRANVRDDRETPLCGVSRLL